MAWLEGDDKNNENFKRENTKLKTTFIKTKFTYCLEEKKNNTTKKIKNCLYLGINNRLRKIRWIFIVWMQI